MAKLEVKGLSIEAGGVEILHDINLNIGSNEVFALFGPNGSGKTTLINTLMGLPQYRIVKGGIFLDGRDISKATVDERVKLGLVLSFQQPPEVKGVSLGDMVNICLSRKPGSILDTETMKMVRAFQMERFLDRNINVDFSGGERKRADLLQLLLLKPRLLMLDEPDSGVDIVSLRLISQEISAYIDRSKASALIITHQGEVLNHLHAQRACILFKGRNYCFHSPAKILKDIRKHGYEGCVSCKVR